ncbi:High-affnity carbon uptake protein Hat/HatR [uncultured Coleofasciculus sp.]|uniref:High-affnity carbon uptake protein Hat/HatR n=1 Tax=uncultured Coleofasciculus sp. TaxID=1267456 RepID=A0A6J4HCU1_9CYAN|nr:High-affnity carbon uptake protein Hat/HatR [uncultured Coleofasciculus sp.]
MPHVNLDVLKGNTRWVWSVAYSPDGTIRLWDIATGECRKILQDNWPYRFNRSNNCHADADRGFKRKVVGERKS